MFCVWVNLAPMLGTRYTAPEGEAEKPVEMMTAASGVHRNHRESFLCLWAGWGERRVVMGFEPATLDLRHRLPTHI